VPRGRYNDRAGRRRGRARRAAGRRPPPRGVASEASVPPSLPNYTTIQFDFSIDT
jgi:hypothetical protein